MAEYTDSRSGQFYPNIHFRSRESLRSSVLYYYNLSTWERASGPVNVASRLSAARSQGLCARSTVGNAITAKNTAAETMTHVRRNDLTI